MKFEDIGKKEKFLIARTSTLYILEDGNLLKLFKNPRDLYEIDRFKYFLEYNNDSFIFPFEFIYDSNNFYGYITKRVYSNTLESVFAKSNLINLSTSSLKLEKDIDYISEGGIVLYDFHDENILYGNKKYSVIDHDENGICKSSSDTKELNRKRHRIMIGKCFEKNIKNNKDTKYILEKIMKYKYMNIKPSEMIITIKEDMERYYKEDINNIEEMNNIIRR